MNGSELFWLFLIWSTLMPLLQQKARARQRFAMIEKIEKLRKSRVIVLIHRQETMTLLGFPLARYITVEDSEELLRAIRMTPPEMPIDLILHTPGGLVLACEQIACALAARPGKVTVFVPHYAMSGGTMLALAADEIVMDEFAVLGPLDPQLDGYPAVSILRAVERKPVEEIDDSTLILADVAAKAVTQMRNVLVKMLSERLPEERCEQIAEWLTSGQFTHDHPIWVGVLRELGFQVSTEMPHEIYKLMSLYPQQNQQRPSVQYIDTPYRSNQPAKRAARV